MKKNLLIKCSCSGEAIEFSLDEEFEMVDVSLWKRGIHDRPMSIRERIRWCLHVLKTGNPWSDYLILDKEGIQDVKEYFNQF